MRRLLILVLLVFACLSVLPAAAQAPATAGAASDPLVSALKTMFDGVARNVAESAEKMPEANYSFRPTPEVRSFGELLGHVANSNFSYCSGVKGESNPNTGNDFEKKTAKADLVKAITDSNAYCDGAFAATPDGKAMEMVKTAQGQSLRVRPLVSAISHTNEHYGNIVTYMRIKGLVPPSTERAQQQMKRPPEI